MSTDTTDGKLHPHPQPPGEDALVRAAGRLQLTFDEEHGGFGRGPKLPQPQLLDFLVRAGARGFGRARAMSEWTLRAMALGGIYDQVGGGFHRHATDRAWRVPDFEKTLAVNALLARAYTHAWQAWHTPLHRRVAEETLDYIVGDLSTGTGALASGEAGEPEGPEGPEGPGSRFYVWSHEELSAVAPEAVAFFGVKEGVEANVLTALGEDRPDQAWRKLREARATRVRPRRDDTVLASWNGLAIGALAEGGATFGRPDLIDAARRAAGAAAANVLDGGDLMHCAGVPGLLEDYAYLSEGLFTLWEATFDRQFLDQAAGLAERMIAAFWDEQEGAFCSTSPGRSDLPAPSVPIADGETPSPNAVAAWVLQRLAALTDREDHRARAVRILRVAGPYLEANPEATASFFAAVDLHALGPKKVVIVGEPGDPAVAALAGEAWTRLVPNRVLSGGAPGSGAPLTEGRHLLGGRPAASVCEEETCLPPTTDPA
ncbi:MAG TPA: thioredoxin domain-containing protein, partial [Actinomycetota bacterium]